MERLEITGGKMFKGTRFFNDSEDDPFESVWKYEILSEVPAHRLKLKDIKILDDWYDDEAKRNIKRKILKDIKAGNLDRHTTSHTYKVTVEMQDTLSVRTVTRK